jgi:hypothetical protein
MKIGYRKPNIKKRLKAQTTGKANRTIKKTINPLYGKKRNWNIYKSQKSYIQ